MVPSEVSALRSPAGTSLAVDHCSIAQENVPRGTTERTAQFKVGQPIPQTHQGELVPRSHRMATIMGTLYATRAVTRGFMDWSTYCEGAQPPCRRTPVCSVP
jgi:hypothetical protein